jgi:hypothetical protein
MSIRIGDSSFPHNTVPAYVSPSQLYNKGAGAILNSSLVFTGWKFPRFMLTEGDDRFLFDVEVLCSVPTRPRCVFFYFLFFICHFFADAFHVIVLFLLMRSTG